MLTKETANSAMKNVSYSSEKVKEKLKYEFISFDIEGAWMNDEDVMGVQERMIHYIWSSVSENDQNLIQTINDYKVSQGEEKISVEVPELPLPRIPYSEAIEIVKNGGGEIEWGDDIESHQGKKQKWE